MTKSGGDFVFALSEIWLIFAVSNLEERKVCCALILAKY